MSNDEDHALHSKKRKLVVESEPDGVSAEPTSMPELIQDENIWFEDGNIVIRAGTGWTASGPLYGFKCHGSILAANSPVFHTMLQLPNTSGEELEGIPCVDLPDAREDVRDLMRFLYGFL